MGAGSTVGVAPPLRELAHFQAWSRLPRVASQAADHLAEHRAQAVSWWSGLDSLLELGALRGQNKKGQFIANLIFSIES